jgi:DNA-binding GntR family transcriptional regulator
MPRPKSGDTSKDLIYKELRHSIVLGQRRPGERLDLEALTKNYGTSITPVRDALQMLSQEGLVEIKPRSGYFVIHITLKQLHDLFDVREILEVAAVERAANRITDEHIEQLESIHANHPDDYAEPSEHSLSENRRFHCLIAEASGNQELAKMVGHIHDRLIRFMAMGHTDESMEQRHARIVEALRTRDAETARNAILEELSQTRQITLERVIQEEGAFWRLGTRSKEELGS